jgi:hypothetical protein
MRRSSILNGITLLTLLLLSPMSIADPISNLSVSLTGTNHTNVTNLSVTASNSSACVWDSLGNWDSEESVIGATNTSASATIAYASGYTETQELYVHSEGSAAPLGTDGSWISYGGPYPAPEWAKVQMAGQQWSFQAATDGVVRFDFNLDYFFDLHTSVPDEYAYGFLRAGLQLWIQSEPWLYEFCGRTILELNPGVKDGADYYASESGVLFSVISELPFTAGQNGVLGIYVENSAGAYTESVVPAPAAVLLGIVGLVGTALKLRKFA